MSVRTVDRQTVLAAISDPTRCLILEKLFDRQPRVVGDFGVVHPHQRNNLRKHLELLAKAGLMIVEQDPKNQRRNLYTLAPAVKTGSGATGRTMDFGYCLLRLDVAG